MKISKLNLNCRQETPANGSGTNEYIFIFAKTPAIFRIRGTEHRSTVKSVVICKSGTPMSCCSAEKTPLLLDSITFTMTSADYQYFSELDIPLNTPIYPSETVVIQNIIKCLHAESLYDEKLSGDFADYAMRLILINISEQLHKINDQTLKDIPHYRQLKEIRRKIYANPVKRWNIDDICEKLGISRTYFHRIYFSAFGVTCMQDVIESRLASAGDMLVSTDYSVCCIAELCGYDSDSYFMRQFKKHTGFTPSEYRRRFSADTAD